MKSVKIPTWYIVWYVDIPKTERYSDHNLSGLGKLKLLTAINFMARLSLRLTTKGVAAYNGRLSVVCATSGASRKRHYKIVEGLQSPSYDPENWNEQCGMFINGASAKKNNAVIKKMMEALQQLVDTDEYMDGKQLFAAYDSMYSGEHKEFITLGKFLSTLVAEMEAECKTSNTELYVTLNRTLLGISKKIASRPVRFTPASYNGARLYDTPINAIGDKHFATFGKWIVTAKNGAGYRNLMTTFKAVISKAYQRGLTMNRLSYKFKDHAPVKAVTTQMTVVQRLKAYAQSVTVLTTEEFERFLQYDTANLYSRTKNTAHYHQLLKDLCLLLYYTRSRPIDVLSFRHGIEYDDKSGFIIYVPRKLAGRRTASGEPRYVARKLPKPAIEIINKWRGVSKGGYLLPFPMNDRVWNIETEFQCL